MAIQAALGILPGVVVCVYGCTGVLSGKKWPRFDLRNPTLTQDKKAFVRAFELHLDGEREQICDTRLALR
ncbi:hypothetical protein DM01DRAFT_1332496 [Hesseltinella vesiculosa]|uniref:Uncharacterized protein n=1 Tax=Hesseltinella vesiculosa TaxID=101127 RepID=A0A1X2GSD6_9FUNG|nr:hypothetical protein DM01DRAFT_1332496 [Hesseltinella vesiculosa]